ncbi:TonB-dependent receptor [Malaciobacter halophilus]|uniref:TonB-dependent receptor n=1 Tax=Malaciobacter halophilus TaxID=197482 RepID=A0A2N1J431_9BACT|nr:TonB-dependent receptor [Malaciobacter halophilus]AXH10419.1 TonB-dependent receptor [Malaciobacter halophilus]PKI81321.1 TonB-dependent receptor [Malaciobacter halophilus]
MKKKLVLSSIASILLLQNSIKANTKIDSVTVTTATKTQRTIDGVSASIQVITQKDIKRINAESLKDIIKKLSGLTIQYGTFPNASSKSKSSISIRGMSANGTLFLIDGRRMAGEVKNPYDLDRIPASSIQRIEIIKGPMSTLYGADALGGVINIITKKPTEDVQIDFSVRYGQNKDGDAKNKNASFSLRGKKDKLLYSIYANSTNTTPYTQKEKANVLVNQIGGPNHGSKQKPSNLTPGTPSYALSGLNDIYNHDVTYKEDSQTYTVGGRFDYLISDNSKVGLDINYFDETRDGSYVGYFHPSNISPAPGKKIPVFNIPVNSKDENERLDLGFDFETNINKDLILKLRAYRSYYEKRNTTTAKYFKQMGYDSKSQSANNGMNANVEILTYEALVNYIANDFHLLTAGVEKRDEEREASVFTSSTDMSIKKVDYKAIYLQDEWKINETINATLGLRYDKISNAENKTTFKVGLVKNFSKELNLRANFAQGYRTPDIREMYINKQTPNGLQQGADVIGYDLKPEFTNSYEIGIFGEYKNLRYSSSIFLNDIDDRISQVLKSNGTSNYYTFENVSNAQTKGFELDLTYDILSNLSTTLSYTELQTKNKDTNKDLEFNPKRTINLSFEYLPTDNFVLILSSRHIGKQYYQENINNTKKDKYTNNYTLFDLSTNYKINKNSEFFFGVDNIFDKEVNDVIGSNIGTFIYTGIRFNF